MGPHASRSTPGHEHLDGAIEFDAPIRGERADRGAHCEDSDKEGPNDTLAPLKAGQCFQASLSQRGEVILHDAPEAVAINGIIVVAQDVAEASDAAPRLVGGEAIRDPFELEGGLRDPSETAFNGIDGLVIVHEGLGRHPSRVLEDAVDVVDDVLKPMFRLTGRQPCAPSPGLVEALVCGRVR